QECLHDQRDVKHQAEKRVNAPVKRQFEDWKQVLPLLNRGLQTRSVGYRQSIGGQVALLY
ncbi:MAG: hypothetical protein WB610_02030, partial [Rhodomicrobium sp.]